MANIRESIQTNKRIMLLLAALLVVIIVFLSKFYYHQKRENQALRLKILSLSENRRTSKAWSQLTTKAPATPVSTPSVSTTSVETAPTTVSQEASSAVPADQDTQEIAVKLGNQMKQVKDLEVASLDENIALADELISREPDSYGAYKAKLISLLVKEGKFNQPADDSEVNGLLESMAQFNVGTDRVARREAALIANTNGEIENAEMQLESIAQQREILESQLSTLDGNSPELARVNAQIQELDNKEAQFASNIENLEGALSNNTSQIVNEDIVEISFMRMMAQNDYDGVVDNAQSFIEQFPNSPSGYFYLVKALESQGQKDEALSVIQNAKLPQDVQSNLLQRLESGEGESPENYWQKLNF